jgi:lysozyme family protein
MANFDTAIPIILKHEGGYVNHPSDPGGATNRGIILSNFVLYADELGLPATVEGLKQLTENQAKYIYRKMFWNRMRGDEIASQNVANILFDGHVNMGGNAIKMIQRIVGTVADGALGPKTVAAINSVPAKALFESYKSERINFYLDLVNRKPQLGVFLKGWMNRINSFCWNEALT